MIEVSYPKLSERDKTSVLANLEIRRQRYEAFVLRKESINVFDAPWNVVIVGDRPGPAAPKDPTYHHTPFYSTKHCSGWLNALLFMEGVDENDLIWINAYDHDGTPQSYEVLDRIVPVYEDRPCPIIALGGNAAKWLKKGGWDFTQVSHPQFHKRFKNKERYALPRVILELAGHTVPDPWTPENLGATRTRSL